LLGELCTGVDDEKARRHLVLAVGLAGSAEEKAVLEKKMKGLR